MMAVLVPLAVSLIAAFAAVGLLARWRGRGAVLDHPGHRSLHAQPTPRLGGVGIAAGVASGLLALAIVHERLAATWLPALPILLLSVREDLKSLPAVQRLAVQFVVAVLLLSVYAGGTVSLLPGVSVQLGWVAFVIGVLAVMWVTNLYNFMDGMDGLAGSMALIGFTSLGIACWQRGGGDIALQAWIVAAACCGFLPWNLPPARIFMGDSGAITLGFLAAGFSLDAAARALLPLWFCLLVFSPFLVDATLTLMVRFWRRERVWEPHRNHLYQRLVLRARGRHGPVLLAELALMLACGASGIILLNSRGVATQWAGLAGWGVAYMVLACVVWGMRDTHLTD